MSDPGAELPDERREPALERLPLDTRHRDRVLAAHERAMELGAFGYKDPATGLLVFTAAYLWERGYCCDTGCRHCPYIGRPGAPDLSRERRV